MNKLDKKQNNGFITIELVLAFAILMINITGIILLTTSFNGTGTGYVINQGQLVSVKNEINQELVYKTQQQLEEKKVQAKNNFLPVVSFPAPIPESSGPLKYIKDLFVSDLTPCVKEVTSKTSWNTSSSNPQKIEFTTLFTDITEALALGGDCNYFSPIGGWSIPRTLISFDLTPAGIPATNLDVLDKMIYLTAMPAVPNQNDFYVFDGTNFQDMFNSTPPPLVASLNTGNGLNAVEAVYYPNLNKKYAFVVGFTEDNNVTCPGNNKPYINQLQVIDLNDLYNPIINRILSNINSCGSYPAGFSIYFNNNKLYVGTKETEGDELTIFDVSTPDNPIELDSISIGTMGRNVNAIVVRNGLAYLATGPGISHNPLKIYDVDQSSPTYKQEVGSFTGTGDEQGTSLFIIGNKLYLGLEKTTFPRPNFYILDISNPKLNPLPILGKKYIPLHNNTSITGIRVANMFAFLTYNDSNPGFQVFNISDVNDIVSISNYNFSQETTGIDYENGFIYTSNRSNDALRIIRPAKCADILDNDSDGKVDNSDSDCHDDNNVINLSSYNPEDDDE